MVILCFFLVFLGPVILHCDDTKLVLERKYVFSLILTFILIHPFKLNEMNNCNCFNSPHLSNFLQTSIARRLILHSLPVRFYPTLKKIVSNRYDKSVNFFIYLKTFSYTNRNVHFCHIYLKRFFSVYAL